MKKMTIYHINKGIGYASSGVEYAQKYRSDALCAVGLKQRFVFLDYLGTNLIHFTNLLGLKMADIIGIYAFMAGQKNHESTYPIAKFEAEINSDFKKIENKTHVLYELKDSPLKYKVWTLNQLYVDRVDILNKGQLISANHYSDRLTNTEYYTNGQLISRTFFTETGEVAYRQYYEKREITMTILDDLILIGRNAFFQEFFKRLKWTARDTVLVDRSLGVMDAVLPQIGKARVGVVIHAEHYHLGRTSDERILWNNHYEYVFENDQLIDWFIVPTKEQARILKAQFKQLNKDASKVVVIPVGCVKEVQNPYTEDKRCRLLTASRLANEKHIDTLIHAVAKAKTAYPDLTFSIYGEGGERKKLEELIQKLGAEDYIQLKGHHQNMAEVYGEYGVYVTASHSEGFGLTLLEALNFGLPMVGLNVPYGNTEFIEEGVNGFLIEKGTDEEIVTGLTKGIEAIQNLEFDLKGAKRFANEKVKGYTTLTVGEKWKKLFANKETTKKVGAK